MNFIKDKGAKALLLGVEEEAFSNIWKIILLDN